MRTDDVLLAPWGDLRHNLRAGVGKVGDVFHHGKPDSFVYDPMNPVTSYGGNVCCTGGG